MPADTMLIQSIASGVTQTYFTLLVKSAEHAQTYSAATCQTALRAPSH